MTDDFVPYEIGSGAYQSFLAAGSGINVVKWLPLPGLGHQNAIIPAELAAMNWFIELHEGNAN